MNTPQLKKTEKDGIVTVEVIHSDEAPRSDADSSPAGGENTLDDSSFSEKAKPYPKKKSKF